MSRFATSTAICTLLLICVGGLVTSKGVGMAVPDWPTTYGYNPFFFPVSKWVGGIREEHTHRLVASLVGLLMTILALWLFGRNSRPIMRWAGLGLLLAGLFACFRFPARWQDGLFFGSVGAISLAASFCWPACDPFPQWLRRLGLIGLVAVVAQGILGGLRVTAMKDELGIFHATLAQLFFCLICAIALFTSRWWREAGFLKAGSRSRSGIRWLFLVATILMLAQIVLGATMRHQHAGLAIPDFPTAYGKVWPDMDPASVARYNQDRVEATAVNPITAFQIGLQMVHRIAAALIAFAVALCAVQARREFEGRSPLGRLSLAWLAMILLQILLGAVTIWTGKSADMATAHVAMGALSLATGTLATLVAMRRPMPGKVGATVLPRALEAERTSFARPPTPAADPQQ